MDQLTLSCSGGSTLVVGGTGGGPAGPFTSTGGFRRALVFELDNTFISGMLMFPAVDNATPFQIGALQGANLNLECSAGKRFIGMHGTAGIYVESLGFICG
jgi:hypothetical protein